MKRYSIILFLILFSFNTVRAQMNDLSQPENTWNSLTESLLTGQSEAVKAVCTPEGYQSIIEIFSPYNDADNPFSASFRSLGENWSSKEISVVFSSNTMARFQIENENISHSFIFIRTDEGWKFHQWIRDGQ